MNEKKYKSIIVLWGIIFLCLQAISIVNVVGLNPENYTYAYKIVASIVAAAVMIMTIIFMVLSLKKKKAGPIIGMILGATHIISFTIINVVVGVCCIISCAGLLKDINTYEAQRLKEKNNKEEK